MVEKNGIHFVAIPIPLKDWEIVDDEAYGTGRSVSELAAEIFLMGMKHRSKCGKPIQHHVRTKA